MWQKDTMTMAEALGISAIGITIVFLTLICLAIAIVIVSKIVNTLVKDEPKAASAPVAQSKPAPSAAPAAGTIAPAELAAIIGAVSLEVNEPLENFEIVSITKK